jgi:hypothetical protein
LIHLGDPREKSSKEAMGLKKIYGSWQNEAIKYAYITNFQRLSYHSNFISSDKILGPCVVGWEIVDKKQCESHIYEKASAF